MTDLPDHDAFARHVGETFVLRPPASDPIEVELVEATALAARGRADPAPEASAGTAIREAPFSLLFRAKGDTDLPQHTYRLEHDALGELDVFLVPVGLDSVGMRFEAIFS